MIWLFSVQGKLCSCRFNIMHFFGPNGGIGSQLSVWDLFKGLQSAFSEAHWCPTNVRSLKSKGFCRHLSNIATGLFACSSGVKPLYLMEVDHQYEWGCFCIERTSGLGGQTLKLANNHLKKQWIIPQCLNCIAMNQLLVECIPSKYFPDTWPNKDYTLGYLEKVSLRMKGCRTNIWSERIFKRAIELRAKWKQAEPYLWERFIFTTLKHVCSCCESARMRLW